jgi:hypothetical protein
VAHYAAAVVGWIMMERRGVCLHTAGGSSEEGREKKTKVL